MTRHSVISLLSCILLRVGDGVNICVVTKKMYLIHFNVAWSDSERAGHSGAEEREGDPGLDH